MVIRQSLTMLISIQIPWNVPTRSRLLFIIYVDRKPFKNHLRGDFCRCQELVSYKEEVGKPLRRGCQLVDLRPRRFWRPANNKNVASVNAETTVCLRASAPKVAGRRR